MKKKSTEISQWRNPTLRFSMKKLDSKIAYLPWHRVIWIWFFCLCINNSDDQFSPVSMTVWSIILWKSHKLAVTFRGKISKAVDFVSPITILSFPKNWLTTGLWWHTKTFNVFYEYLHQRKVGIRELHEIELLYNKNIGRRIKPLVALSV